MGGAASRRKNRNTPIPSYTPATGTPGISRPGAVGTGNVSPINRDQQRELMQANQTIANLNNQLNAIQRGGVGIPPLPYGGYPLAGGIAPVTPYGIPPVVGPYSPYAPPSPLLPYYRGQPMLGGIPYRDTDYASIANIAGLNPADVAILHREFMNLTRGGATKIDRVIFRQLLRDVLLQANNENVDRAIENMFLTIDRNHDGFIDFTEFVGAFKDVLKGHATTPQSYFEEHVFPDLLGEQLRASGVGSGIASQPIAPIALIQQPQPATQLVTTGGLSIVPLASTGIQQVPVVYGGVNPLQFSDATPPLLTLDPNQSSYVIATPGQYLITQPTALQCVPLPMV